jgi:anthranilate phosphoribosyltransferase
MLRKAIKVLTEGINLSRQEMKDAIRDIMEGRCSDIQIASFLTALSMKGETVEEITGAVMVTREKAQKIAAPKDTVDTCGTGGDMAGTFNISTTSALIVASAGTAVAKHGNRSVSSRSGSADVLEALGINLELSVEKAEQCLKETGFGFLFAPLFHPAMKYAVKPRKEIGIRTIFNIIGPLTNPAQTKRQVIGVFSPDLTEVIAGVLNNLGCTHAFVVHGDDGLDEISITDKTKVTELKNGQMITYSIAPEDAGLPRASIDDIIGGDAEDNARIILSIMNGEKTPKRDIVLINAAAALVAGDKAKHLRQGVTFAAEAIDSGAARKKLEEIKRFTHKS